MRIPAGEYDLPERQVRLALEADLELAAERSIYVITGNNGLGKTSFLERVVIPALRREAMPYLYLGQDAGLQLYTIRASLAVQGLGLGRLSEADLLRVWLKQSPEARVLLLDEFDKYEPDPATLVAESRDFITTYIMITHGDPQAARALAGDWPAHHLRFHLVEWAGGVKRVRVEREAPWL
ncbi:MAG: hypothetical protein GXY76_08040 [Chloroflexi bacterium]|nr:hypothetical protein [Chloroflexota bacterium]